MSRITLQPDEVSQGMVKKLLRYYPESGIFVWRVNRRAGASAGNEAGCIKVRDGRAYRAIYLHGREYLAHRLAWFYMTGEWPPGNIDHCDNDASNNSWKNLRIATISQNGANAKRYSTNTSGLKGVCWNKKAGRWQASIKKDGRNIYLGLFDTPEEAHAAYVAKAIELFGEFARAA